jgi:hypothetical protein
MILLDEAEGAYRLSESGKRGAECVLDAAYKKMAMLQPLPSAELERLAGLLRRLVMSCLEAPEPPGKWCITHSRKTDPGDQASGLVRVDQFLSDLAAYRDDAHLAALLHRRACLGSLYLPVAGRGDDAGRNLSEISPPWIFARGVSFGVGRLDRTRLGGRKRWVSNHYPGKRNSPDCRRAYRSVLLLALVLLDSSGA